MLPLAALAAAVLVLAVPGTAWSAGLYVAEPGAPGGADGRIVALEALFAAEQAVVASGGMLADPQGLAVQSDGQVLVADATGKVVRVHPGTGAQTLVASGGLLSSPRGTS